MKTTRWVRRRADEITRAVLVGVMIGLLIISVGNGYLIRSTQKSNQHVLSGTIANTSVLIGLEAVAEAQNRQVEMLLRQHAIDKKSGGRAFSFAVGLLTRGQAETDGLLTALCQVTAGCEAQLNNNG